MRNDDGILLVGAGPMAVAYATVLRALGRGPVVVGRGARSAAAFTAETGLTAAEGGLERWLSGQHGAPPATAIVACGERWVGIETRRLVEAGVGRILVEKPGGFDATDIVATARAAADAGADVRVGYNRRFHASVEAARGMIEEDGGVSSFSFEFTERSSVIETLEKEDGVKDEWFLSNSTHVIDLAFHLGGRPDTWHAFAAGSLSWHPAGSKFTGAGRTAAGALFSYCADWSAPGRWGLEVNTARRRLIFRPLESLQVQHYGSMAIEPVPLDDRLDREFKPGLFRQVEAFLAGDSPHLPTLQEQADMLPAYLAMRRGTV